MSQLIAVGIGILVFIVGFVIYRIGLEILDEGDYFFYAVGFFLLLFTICGVALYFLLPRPPASADLTTVTPDKMIDRITEFAQRPYATREQAISYSLTAE